MTSCDQKEVHQSSTPCTDKLLTPPSFIYICVFSQCKLNIESSFTFLLDLAPSWHFLGKWLLSGFWSWPRSARQVLQAWTLDAYGRATEFHIFVNSQSTWPLTALGEKKVKFVSFHFWLKVCGRTEIRCLEDWGCGSQAVWRFFLRKFIHFGKRRLS